MNEEKKSLGRGLDSLLGERAERSTQGVLEVPLEDLVPGQYQPRNKMHKDTLDELSKSIKSQGYYNQFLLEKKLQKDMRLLSAREGGGQPNKQDLKQYPQ